MPKTDQQVIKDFNARFTGHASSYFRDRYLANLIRRDEQCAKLEKKAKELKTISGSSEFW